MNDESMCGDEFEEVFSEEKFRSALESLTKVETIKSILSLLEGKGELHLYHAKIEGQEKKLHFLIEKDGERIKLYDAAVIQRKISELLGYNGIVVELKRMFNPQKFLIFFDDKPTQFSEQNTEGVKAFLREHYPSPHSSKENTPRKVGLNTVLSTIDDFLEGASREDIERFSTLCSERISSKTAAVGKHVKQ